jgi:hypothetical protein
MYRRTMMEVLRHFFLDSAGFHVYQEESRGELYQAESKADMAVLKVLSRPGGSFYTYDFLMVESKRADQSWPATEIQLSRHCGGTDNPSGQVYGIVHVGLYMQFFKADRGVLTPLSARLHIRNNVNDITAWFGHVIRTPLPMVLA